MARSLFDATTRETTIIWQSDGALNLNDPNRHAPVAVLLHAGNRVSQQGCPTLPHPPHTHTDTHTHTRVFPLSYPKQNACLEKSMLRCEKPDGFTEAHVTQCPNKCSGLCAASCFLGMGLVTTPKAETRVDLNTLLIQTTLRILACVKRGIPKLLVCVKRGIPKLLVFFWFLFEHQLQAHNPYSDELDLRSIRGLLDLE